MDSIWKDILTALFMGAVLPGMMLNGAAHLAPPPEPTVAETVETQPRPVYPMRCRQEDGTVRAMDLEEYIVGVVLGEMPASFDEEALKAQAVVARTYTQKAYVSGGKHGDGSVCVSPYCCQAYMDPETCEQEAVEKVRAAVEATFGEVLTYEGSLIESTYFSCSGGKTEDAAAVWGTDFPYLQGVDSPGEEGAAHYTDTVTFTPQSFCEALGQTLSGSPESWFGEAAYTEGGGVAEMTIGGQAYAGTKLRRLLNLRSTAFTVQAGQDKIQFTTKGYGHRVGMSQYGADAMAAAGKTYREILAHYYQGTKIEYL